MSMSISSPSFSPAPDSRSHTISRRAPITSSRAFCSFKLADSRAAAAQPLLSTECIYRERVETLSSEDAVRSLRKSKSKSKSPGGGDGAGGGRRSKHHVRSHVITTSSSTSSQPLIFCRVQVQRSEEGSSSSSASTVIVDPSTVQVPRTPSPLPSGSPSPSSSARLPRLFTPTLPTYRRLYGSDGAVLFWYLVHRSTFLTSSSCSTFSSSSSSSPATNAPCAQMTTTTTTTTTTTMALRALAQAEYVKAVVTRECGVVAMMSNPQLRGRVKWVVGTGIGRDVVDAVGGGGGEETKRRGKCRGGSRRLIELQADEVTEEEEKKKEEDGDKREERQREAVEEAECVVQETMAEAWELWMEGVERRARRLGREMRQCVRTKRMTREKMDAERAKEMWRRRMEVYARAMRGKKVDRVKSRLSEVFHAGDCVSS